MNLKALREGISNLLDYTPELQSFKNQLDELINEAVLHIWTARRWNFAIKQTEFKFYPDITPTRDKSAGGVDVTASVVQGSRQVVFSTAMDRLTRAWEGQPIELSGYEYIISRVVASDELLLATQYHGATETDLSDWKIKHRYYDLEQNCIELLSLAHKDTPVPGSANPVRGKLISLMARTEEELNLRTDYTAEFAEAYVLSAPLMVPPAERTVISNVTLRETATTEGFPENSYLEVCWAFERDGHVGALSEPATITFPEVENGSGTYTANINFRTWDDQPIVADTFKTQDSQPSQYEGYHKVIYWNANYDRSTGTRLGLPCWVQFNVAGLAASRNADNYLDVIYAPDIDSFVTISLFAQINPGNPRYIEYDGQYQRIRPYPRVDGWDVAVPQVATNSGVAPKLHQDYLRTGVQRYYYKPALLTKATDSPELPYEFHQLIIYRALEQVYLKLGQANMSELYRRRINDAMKLLEKRYMDRIDSLIRRGQFGTLDSSALYYPDSLRKLN